GAVSRPPATAPARVPSSWCACPPAPMIRARPTTVAPRDCSSSATARLTPVTMMLGRGRAAFPAQAWSLQGELGRDVQEVAPEALARLRAYSWPGNLRELQSVLKQALLQARGATLRAAYLPALPAEPGGSVPASPVAAEDTSLEAFLRLCLA